MKRSTTQYIITGMLILLLIGIVSGYIYFGIQKAKTDAEPVVDMAPTVVELPEEQTMTEADRLKILEQLRAESGTSTLTMDEKQRILDTMLEESETQTLSTEQRLEIMESLESTVPEMIQ